MDRLPSIVAILIAISVILGACGPRTLEADLAPGGWPDFENRATAGLNEALLAEGAAAELLLRVDWAEGSDPAPEALDHLVGVLKTVCPVTLAIRVERGGVIPSTALAEASALEALGPLAEQRIGDEELAEDTALVWVLYLPRSEPFYEPGWTGMSDSLPMDPGGALDRLPVLLVFHETVHSEAMLWIGAAKIEGAMLVHEMGHVLGLVANAEHEQKDFPGHCTRNDCVMHRAKGADLTRAIPALFGKIPRDYCDLCRADLARARASWALRE